ncbi:MAG: FMN-binding protein [Patescibacteria group bacterium]|nr:FMN-binding protein [Patescibacteria group bacterium]
MKKAALSLLLIFTFTAYVLYVRIIGTEAPVTLAPEPNKPNVTLSLPQYNNTTTTKSPTSTKPKPTQTPIANTGKYKNGSYTGSVADATYGNVQVKAIISGGKITDVQFLDYPQDRQNSIRINSFAMPYLISEAITAQGSNVDTVSGASFTSAAFRESLASALSQALN